MRKYFDVLYSNSLFDKISRESFDSLIDCLEPTIKTFQKHEFVLHIGDKVDFIGIVVDGEIKIVSIDEQGNESIVNKIESGEMFGEVFACSDIQGSPVSVIAEKISSVVYIDYNKIITPCNSSSPFHSSLISNMLKIIASKTLFLNKKVDIISKRNLRAKITAYLEYERRGRDLFKISLNREELANFLCADRSALSAELSKMQKEGLIRYNRNEFEIL